MQWAATEETALDLFAQRPAQGFLTGLRFLDATVLEQAAGVRGDGDFDGYQPRQVVEVGGDGAAPTMLVLLHVIAAFLTREQSGGESGSVQNERVYVFDHECDVSAPLLFRILCERLRDRGHINERKVRVIDLRYSIGCNAERCNDGLTYGHPTALIGASSPRHGSSRALSMPGFIPMARDPKPFALSTARRNPRSYVIMDSSAAPLQEVLYRGDRLTLHLRAPAAFLMVFHCIGSFHLIDKLIAKRVGDGLALGNQVFVLLKQFIRHHSPFVFASKNTVSSARSGGWDTAEYMPSSWSSQVTKRIQLRASSWTHKDAEAKPGRHPTFEARCFSQGKSRIFNFFVDSIDIREENEELARTAAQVITPQTRPETDTNAAQLWMH